VCRIIVQEFATAVKQLAHRAYLALPENYIMKEAGKAFDDGVDDPAIKNPAAPGKRENAEWGSQAGPRTAGRACRSQTPKHER
jgi:hypothetical protein